MPSPATRPEQAAREFLIRWVYGDEPIEDHDDYGELQRWKGFEEVCGELAALLASREAEVRVEQHRASYRLGWRESRDDPTCLLPVDVGPPPSPESGEEAP